MNFRVFFLLVVLVLVWSGHVADRPANASGPMAVLQCDGHCTTASVGEASPGVQTTQAVEEGVVDLVGLLPSGTDTSPPALLMAWPSRYASLAWTAPYLDGPQRPPRAARPLA